MDGHWTQEELDAAKERGRALHEVIVGKHPIPDLRKASVECPEWSGLLTVAADTIATLRARLERAERERDEARKPRMFPVMCGSNHGRTYIPWEIAERAYEVYSSRYGTQQSLERLAQRGGFGDTEMDMFYPEWRSVDRVIGELRAERDQLRATLARITEAASGLPEGPYKAEPGHVVVGSTGAPFCVGWTNVEDECIAAVLNAVQAAKEGE